MFYIFLAQNSLKTHDFSLFKDNIISGIWRICGFSGRVLNFRVIGDQIDFPEILRAHPTW